jgi:hypothetical protein
VLADNTAHCARQHLQLQPLVHLLPTLHYLVVEVPQVRMNMDIQWLVARARNTMFNFSNGKVIKTKVKFVDAAFNSVRNDLTCNLSHVIKILKDFL